MNLSTWLGFGAHLANLDDPPEEVYMQLDRAQPELIITMWGYTRHKRAVYDRIEALARFWERKPIYCVRLGAGVMDDKGVVNDYRAALEQIPAQVITEERLIFRLLNEINLPEEGYADAPHKYAELFYALRVKCPFPLLVSNLCLNEGWEYYLRALRDCGLNEVADGWAMSLYADSANPLTIMPYLALGKPLIAVEFGIPWYRGAQRAQWWQQAGTALKASGVSGLAIFIIGGETGGHWPAEYILDEYEACAASRVRRELRISPFVRSLPV